MVKINVQDTFESGITDDERAFISGELGKRFEGTGIEEIYLTPSAQWSDHCVHEYLSGENQHMEGEAPFCQLNGAVYKMLRSARVRDVFKSPDLSGSISFFDYSVSSNVNEPEKVASIAVELQQSIRSKMKEVKEAVGKFFVSKRGGTALSIFKGYEVENEEDLRVNLMKFKSTALKIGSRNGFVFIGFFSRVSGDQITYTVKLAVRSYDEMSSMALLEKVYKDNPTVEQFAGSEYEKYRYACRKNAIIQQGHIAYEVLIRVLGLHSSSYNITSEAMTHGGPNITYMQPNDTLYYNWIGVNSDKTYSYYDHCYQIEQIVKIGYWPYFTGRGSGLSLLMCNEKSDLYSIPNTVTRDTAALPMGPRKILHRSQHKLSSEYTPIDEFNVLSEEEIDAIEEMGLGEGSVSWMGQGERHYKLVKGKYSNIKPDQLLKEVYKYEGECKFQKVATWAIYFGQEFGPNTKGTMGINDKLFLFNDPVVAIEMNSKFYHDNFSNLLLWGAYEKKYKIDKILKGQIVDKLIILIDRDILDEYLRKKT